MLSCAYAIFHLARPAGARPPASSAGYQAFASVTDLATLPLYTYGCLSVKNSSAQWGTLLSNEALMEYFLPSLYYTLFGGACTHLVSLCISLWLALKFRQIARLPPDMNPLEDNLTSRHKKKFSVATTATYLSDEDKRLSTPLEGLRRSGMPYDDIDRPPAVPFHATRSTPRSSFGSADFPLRQYQITPGNSPKHSPRNSATAEDLKRMSAPPSSSHSGNAPAPPPRSPWRNSHGAYAGVPTQDISDFRPPQSRGSAQAPPSPRSYNQASRPGTSSSTPRQQQQSVQGSKEATGSSPPRPARFTESWYATESLFNRTHARNRAQKGMSAPPQGYEAIHRRYDLSDSDPDSEYENETATAYSVMSPPATEIGIDSSYGDLGTMPSPGHPNPLRSNPSLPSMAGTLRTSVTTSSVSTASPSPSSSSNNKPGKNGRRPNTPFVPKAAALSEIDLNDRRVSGGTIKAPGADVAAADQKADAQGSKLKKHSPSKRYTWAPRDRVSSIQPESDFYSKPYGDLRSGTPPVLVGGDRQVSSGNDYGDLGAGSAAQAAKRNFSFGKRNVSGKIAEEGRGDWAVGWAR